MLVAAAQLTWMQTLGCCSALRHPHRLLQQSPSADAHNTWSQSCEVTQGVGLWCFSVTSDALQALYTAVGPCIEARN